MSRRFASLVVSVALLLPTAALLADSPTTSPASQPAAATEPGAKLDQILADLASDDWKLRQQAADSLATIDRSQLPRIKKLIENTTDVDLRTALLAAVVRIEEQSLATPSLVSIHVKDAPAVEVLTAIGKQLDFDLVTDSADWIGDAKLTVDVDRQPFWVAMKTLAPQWPVRVNPAPNDAGRLRLFSTGPDYLNARAVVVGPFLVCPVSLQTSGWVDLLAAAPVAKYRSVGLQLAVLPEPKLRTSRLTVAMKECVDENGKSFKPNEGNGAMPLQMISPVSQASMTTIRLTPPADAGKRLARLSGAIRFRVPLRTRRIEVADLAGSKDRAVDLGGRQVKATLTSRDKEYDVKISLPPNANIQDELSIAQVRDMSLLDAQGNPLYRKSTTQAMAGRNWEFTTTFAREGLTFGRQSKPTGEPAKLIWDLPVESKDMELPFELTNIPLSQ